MMEQPETMLGIKPLCLNREAKAPSQTRDLP